MSITAKLEEPCGDKNWALEFCGVPFNQEYPEYELRYQPERANIWYQCRHFGEYFKVSPFLQGNSEDWMMIEFWCSSQSRILECCIKICNELNIELAL